jgi:hypothetical protein
MAGKQIVIVGEIYEQVGSSPPGIWGGGNAGFPTHPIAPGGQPPGIWGGPPAYPDQGLPGGGGRPSHPIAPGGGPSQGPGFPTHPIAPGGQPPGIWPSPGHPDQGLPGQPPGPSQGGPFPTPPIFIPPGLPPVDPPPPDQVEWHSAWSSETGWITVGIPTGEAPTPSSGGEGSSA